MRRAALLLIALTCAVLNGCAYLGTVASQSAYSIKQRVAPEQRTAKHLLDRNTAFVFGRILGAPTGSADTMTVIAVSDAFRDSEVVDVNTLARPDSYYGLNLPDGRYHLLAVVDRNANGVFTPDEVAARRDVVVDTHQPGGSVVGDVDIDLSTPYESEAWTFRVATHAAVARAESIFYPTGTLRTLDDAVFSPEMASLGLYRPSAFLEEAPMMFYALEEDLGHKVPVVFVHGIGGSPREFAAIVARLDRTRFKPWFFYYPSGMDLKQLGAMFYKLFLSGEVIPSPEVPMVIVAHSMGGLVVREAMNNLKESATENRVPYVITVSSPFGGHPDARAASHAPVPLPAWRDLNPEAGFIANLHRKPLPAITAYHLVYTFGHNGNPSRSDANDGSVPLRSQLADAAQREARSQRGFAHGHTEVLRDPEAIDHILGTFAQARPPFPEAALRSMAGGGYPAAAEDPAFLPLEAYFVRHYGRFMDALVAGEIAPFHPVHEHFLRAARGEAEAENPFETAWVKLSRAYPDRRERGSKP